MAEAYGVFGSFILFKEALADELGHMYRAGELERGSLKRTVWLRVFDGAGVPVDDLAAQKDTGNRVGELLQAANVAAEPRYFIESGTPAVAWTHVSGQPLALVLAKVVEEGFPVPVDNCLLILEKLSLALSAALTVEIQGESLVHGFLHPGLVIVSNDGEAQVAGFGAADELLGMLDQGDAAARFAGYMAPEVLTSRTGSKRGDVYSLGAILFQLLTGSTLPVDPGARATALSGAELAYDEQPIPDDIRALLERALADRPEDRFSSAVDFKKELDRLLYGGAYSPTTFNLALFMDRLFRSEIEVEEKERIAEAELDVTPYVKPEPAPEPEDIDPGAPAARGNKGMWIGIAGAAIAVIAVIALFFGRGPATPPVEPTPSPQDIRAKREAEQQRIKQLVDQQLQEMLAQKEEEIRTELKDRQGRIDELQKRLKDMERKAVNTGGQDTQAARREREALAQQIATEETAKKQREEALEAERQQALEEARKQAEAAAALEAAAETTAGTTEGASPTVAEEVVSSDSGEAGVSGAVSVEPEEPPPVQPEPTPVKREAAKPSTAATGALAENSFVDPTEIDSPPVLIKDRPVVWPRPALHSRRKGVVIMQATVNARGQVEDVKILRTDNDGFGIPQAASEAVRGYIYKPGSKDGVRVKTTITVTIPYAFSRR